MAPYRRVLNVFLASPGDLVDERRAAKGVVDEVAMTARELGVSLELLGWEDTLPGARRPQEAINKDLDEAELFVGLLWRRWGQSPGRPEFSSGFEEEYHRARTRYAESGSPEVWLFFKDIEPAQRQDPGDQLRKVLFFRDQCESEKKIFFKEFGTTEDWTRLFRSHLSRYVARFAKNATNEPAGEGLELSSRQQVKPPSSESEGHKAPSLLPVASILSDLANGGDPKPHAIRDGGVYAARLYLLGLSLLAQSPTSSGLASTHEINTLFRFREASDLLSVEKALLRRTVLADRAGVKPGWYWFPKGEQEQLNVIIFYAVFGDDSDVRRGALALLTEARIRRNEWADVLFAAHTALAQPEDVQAEFWTYLETIVTATDRERLDAMLAAGAASERVTNLVLIARSFSDPGRVLAEAASAPHPPSGRLLAELTK